MTEISGKVAVVTGGGSGIGMGLAKELARQGAAVAVTDIRLESARNVADAIVATGGKAIALQCDVCERSSIAAMRDAVVAALGPVQLVFANAGATSFTPLLDMTDEDVDWIIQVNLMGVMNTTRAFLPGMIAAGGGHICATTSMAGLLPGWMPVHVPYSAAKMGIIGMMMNLAIEMREHNVFTTSYCPGGVASGMKANNGTYRPEKFGGPEPVAEVQFSGTDTTHKSMPSIDRRISHRSCSMLYATTAPLPSTMPSSGPCFLRPIPTLSKPATTISMPGSVPMACPRATPTAPISSIELLLHLIQRMGRAGIRIGCRWRRRHGIGIVIVHPQHGASGEEYRKSADHRDAAEQQSHAQTVNQLPVRSAQRCPQDNEAAQPAQPGNENADCHENSAKQPAHYRASCRCRARTPAPSAPVR